MPRGAAVRPHHGAIGVGIYDTMVHVATSSPDERSSWSHLHVF